ncbi:FtsX-like permease family protein [Lentimicrobium sp.]
MKLPIFIAWRYLKSKKSHNAINIISGISVAGITIGSMALIVVLSVFNGFESLVISLYNTFDPQIKVYPASGKTFDRNSFPWENISKLTGIKAQTGVVEEKVLLRYGSNQYLAVLKGVDDNFIEWSSLDSMITEGSLMLKFKDQPLAIPGQGVAYYLNLNLVNYGREIEVYAARRSGPVSARADQAFHRMDIRPAGIFSVQQDFDSKYVIVPLSFAEEVLEAPNQLSAVEIALKQGENINDMQQKIADVAGSGFMVKNRFQQQPTLYRVMQTEKWAIFMILGFILFIAAFNLIGSLSMLILDKKKDIVILRSMGASHPLIRKIFLTEGLLVSLSGAIGGLCLGGLISWLQQEFKLIKINTQGGSFLIDAYPVQMQLTDFVNVFLVISAIGLLAAWIPAYFLTKARKDRTIL